jgi:hypothetical protein
MTMSFRDTSKTILGTLPLTAEIDWYLRGRSRTSIGRFSLRRLSENLPGMVDQVMPHAKNAPAGRKVFVFATLHFWIQHAAVTSLALAGLGHKVTLVYLPFGDFSKPINRFDLQRQNIYARASLKKASPLVRCISLLDVHPAARLPENLRSSVEKVCLYDAQYILQTEQVNGDEPVYQLRRSRNMNAARRALTLLKKDRPEVVITPNGMIQEFGAFYETARSLDIPVVTYEFGEQDQRVWLGQNRLVMFHDTDDLWAARKHRQLSTKQRTWLEKFIASRQGMQRGDRFAHLWQTASPEGGVKTRASLGLDDRPIVLLPTNVMGDSATLGRTLISGTISEWVAGVVKFFAERPQVQLVIRVHPAESKSVGPSIVDVIRRSVPNLPGHIHVIGAMEKINTYDLIEICDLALVFTTTAGLEICTRGIPVAVSGRAHYRGKGFTLDAESWDEYFSKLDKLLVNLPAQRLTPEQVEAAWNYTYAFFNEYPRPFPWHIEHLWPGLEKRPLSHVLGDTGRSEYERTFQELTGKTMEWKDEF